MPCTLFAFGLVFVVTCLRIATVFGAVPEPDRSWLWDCRKGEASRIDVHLRIFPAAARLRPRFLVWKWTTTGEPLGQPEHAVFSDIDGNGKADIILQRSDGTILRGTPTSHHTIDVATVPGLTRPLDLAHAVVLGGAPGECGRLLLPPADIGGTYETISMARLRGDSPTEPIGGLRRLFDRFEMNLLDDGAHFPAILVREPDSPSALIWRYREHAGWVEAPHSVLAATFIGMGRVPWSGAFASFNEVRIPFDQRVVVVYAGASVEHTLDPIIEQGRFPELAVGDLDGDSVTDVFLGRAQSPFAASRMTLLLPETSLSVSLPGLRELLGKQLLLGIGDLDGNGRAEIVTYESGRLESIEIAAENQPCRDLRVEVDGTEIAISPTGEAHFRLDESATGQLRASSTECEVLPDAAALRGRGADVSSVLLTVAPRRSASGSSETEASANAGTYPCSGFVPTYGLGYSARLTGQCPRNYAVFEVDDALDRFASCCPLPADLLRAGSPTVSVESNCPPGYIVTGIFTRLSNIGVESAKHLDHLQCSAVDTSRYRIEEPTPGVYWGEGSRSILEDDPPQRSDMPNGLREGIGRTSRRSWDTDGCIGRPWGSVVVGTHGSRCRDVSFARVLPLHRVVPEGDPFPIGNPRTAIDPAAPIDVDTFLRLLRPSTP